MAIVTVPVEVVVEVVVIIAAVGCWGGPLPTSISGAQKLLVKQVLEWDKVKDGLVEVENEMSVCRIV